LAVGGFDGEDVPGIGGDYVGGDEVDVAGRVGDSVGVEVAFVGVAAVEDGAFDLDAAEAAAVVGDEVVGCGVSPGFRYAELQFQGSGDETELRPFAARFRVADGFAWGFHLFLKTCPGAMAPGLRGSIWARDFGEQKRRPVRPPLFYSLYPF